MFLVVLPGSLLSSAEADGTFALVFQTFCRENLKLDVYLMCILLILITLNTVSRWKHVWGFLGYSSVGGLNQLFGGF